jgi:hypothetical protein
MGRNIGSSRRFRADTGEMDGERVRVTFAYASTGLQDPKPGCEASDTRRCERIFKWVLEPAERGG